MKDSDIERFFSKVNKTPTCWNWTAAISKAGYGVFGFGSNTIKYAHRVSLHYSRVSLKPGMVVDHICRNKKCVNPAHLRQVTRRVNVIENNSSCVTKNASKSFCVRGHEFTPLNTRLVSKRGRNNPMRVCLLCYEIKKEKQRVTNA